LKALILGANDETIASKLDIIDDNNLHINVSVLETKKIKKYSRL